MLMTAIAVQAASSPMNPAGYFPAATAITLIGTPRASEAMASTSDPDCSRRRDDAADPAASASRASARASICRPSIFEERLDDGLAVAGIELGVGFRGGTDVIGRQPVSHETLTGWRAAARMPNVHFAEQGLAAIVLMIATTNLFNRLNLSTRQVAGAWG